MPDPLNLRRYLGLGLRLFSLSDRCRFSDRPLSQSIAVIYVTTSGCTVRVSVVWELEERTAILRRPSIAMDISFAGKRVLVTGAERGIGRAIALRVIACGGQAIALSLNQTNLDTLKAECPSVETVACDLTDWEATRAAVEALGPVHCLVNNAGVSHHKPFLDATEPDFDKTFAVNLKAALNVSQVVARGMVARGEGGVIVNISAVASLRPVVDHAVYCASKTALDHLMRVMTLELGPHGIRVNCINPITVPVTEMGKKAFLSAEKAEEILKGIPLGRFAEIEDVVNAVLFLLSDKASLISGVTLPVDGGFTAC